MKINEERVIQNNQLDIIIEKSISTVGIQKTLKRLKEAEEKSSINFQKDIFKNFKNDLKSLPYAGINTTKSKDIIKRFNLFKKNLPIFEIENKNFHNKDNLKGKQTILPFNSFFISTQLLKIIGNELYRTKGLFISKTKEGLICIDYIWSRTIKDGWSCSSMVINPESFTKQVSEINIAFDFQIKDKSLKEFHFFVGKETQIIIRELINRIITENYKSYKVHENGKLIEKEIVFIKNVKSHKRHFWKDSGKFKIPLMEQSEWEKKGYGTDHLAVRGDEIRSNVPFKIIGSINKEKENKTYSLIKKRIWRSEQKVYDILKELFPNNYIRRHDRRTLNGLELDFNLPELRLGIEYDGEQHFDRKVCEEVFKSDFDAQLRRDREKNKRCRKKNIHLIRIKYDEPLTKTHIKKRLKEVNLL